MELTFRKAGDPKAPLDRPPPHRVRTSPTRRSRARPLEKHLLAKGKVVAMTKAASYLIWDWRVLGDPRLPARQHGVDGVGRDGHPAAGREEGRVHPDHVRHVHRRRSSRRRTRPSARTMVKTVGDAAPAQAAVPLRLSRHRQARPPDDHAARRSPRNEASLALASSARSTSARAVRGRSDADRRTGPRRRPLPSTSRARRRGRARPPASPPPPPEPARRRTQARGMSPIAARAAPRARGTRTTATAASRRRRTRSPAARTGGSRPRRARCTCGSRRATTARPPAPSIYVHGY